MGARLSPIGAQARLLIGTAHRLLLELRSEMSTNIGVSQVYFINLASRTDRLDHMNRQLEGCQWPVERVEAVRLEQDPKELGYEVLPRLQGQWHVVSIWLSHLKALETAVRQKESGAIVILEDDVRIRPEMWSDEISLCTTVNADWDIIFLSPRYRANPTANSGSGHTRRKWISAPFGAAPVLLKTIRSRFICTGAHFCIFKSGEVVRTVVSAMRACKELYDVDLFYLSQFQTYGVDDPRVATAPLGSDHG